MTPTATRALIAASLLTGALGATAVAADPDKGTVSADSPKVTWRGQVSEGSYFVSRAMILADATGNGGDVPCDQGCDSFALTVATKKDLTVSADSPATTDDPGQTVIRVTKPDGSYLTTVGESSEGKPVIVKFKNADTGDYAIDVSDNYADAHEYAGSASLAVPPPAAGPTAPPAAPPATSNPPASGGTQGQDIDLAVKAGKASLRKLRKSRKLTAKVTVSREVAKLSGFLRKGKATIATATRGKTSGTVSVTLKLAKKAAKKLKKGTLTLTFVADDGQGTTATRTVKVKVGR